MFTFFTFILDMRHFQRHYVRGKTLVGRSERQTLRTLVANVMAVHPAASTRQLFSFCGSTMPAPTTACYGNCIHEWYENSDNGPKRTFLRQNGELAVYIKVRRMMMMMMMMLMMMTMMMMMLLLLVMMTMMMMMMIIMQ